MQRKDLLEAAERARRLERAKFMRVTRKLGVRDLGRYTPRLPSKDHLKRLTNKQLESYIKSSESFRSRTTSFVRLAEGVTTTAKVRPLIAEMRKYEKAVNKAMDRVKDVKLNSLYGISIGERMKQVTPDNVFLREGDYGFAGITDMRQVASEKALRKLYNKVKKINSVGVHRSARRQANKSLRKVFDGFSVFGDQGIQQRIKNLSDEQFYALWRLSDFTNNFFLVYEAYKQLDSVQSNTKFSMFVDTSNQALEDIKGLLNDIEAIS